MSLKYLKNCNFSTTNKIYCINVNWSYFQEKQFDYRKYTFFLTLPSDILIKKILIGIFLLYTISNDYKFGMYYHNYFAENNLK